MQERMVLQNAKCKSDQRGLSLEGWFLYWPLPHRKFEWLEGLIERADPTVRGFPLPAYLPCGPFLPP